LAIKENVDLVLMDMQMPELDGTSAARELRTLQFAKPIVALTANVMNEEKAHCIESGCNEFVTKPIDRDHFFSVLAQFLKSAPTPEAPQPTPALKTPDSPPADTALLRSNRADDQKHAAILERFVQRLPNRVAELTRLMDEENLIQLEQAVHKLKGAAGGYGFPQITEAATRAEQAIRGQAELQTIVQEISNLVRLISRVDGYSGQTPAAEAAPVPKLRVDPATGLFNYRYLNERLPTELSMGRRNSRPLSIVRLRIAELGCDEHTLRSVGGIILARCQGENIGFRLTETDFLLVLPNCDATQAEATAQALRVRIDESERLKVDITFAEADSGVLSANDLLSRLDRPMQEQ